MKLIIEGTNGIGKDVLLKYFVKHIPIANIYYAPSSNIANLGVERYEDTCYTTFNTIEESINKLSSKADSIQYRSPLTNIIYNKIMRPEEKILMEAEDRTYNYIINTYKENTEFLICVYDKYTIKKITKDNCHTRIRKESYEYLDKVNNEYKNMYYKLYNDPNRQFSIAMYEGEGTEDLITDMINQVKCSIIQYNPKNILLLDIDNVLLDWFDEEKSFLVDDLEYPGYWPNTVSNSYFVKGNLCKNLKNIIKYLNKNYIIPLGLKNLGIKLFTARTHKYLQFIINLNRILIAEIAENYSDLDCQLKILSNNTSLCNVIHPYIKGGTFFKSYTIYNYLKYMINNHNTFNLIYLDDKGKYIENSYFNAKLLKKEENLKNLYFSLNTANINEMDNEIYSLHCQKY